MVVVVLCESEDGGLSFVSLFVFLRRSMLGGTLLQFPFGGMHVGKGVESKKWLDCVDGGIHDAKTLLNRPFTP